MSINIGWKVLVRSVISYHWVLLKLFYFSLITCMTINEFKDLEFLGNQVSAIMSTDILYQIFIFSFYVQIISYLLI